MSMRKSNNIWYMIWLVIGISFFISGCPFKSGVERKAWFRYASKYDQAQSKMAASGGALQDYNKALKIEQKFLRAKQPTETEIISVLRSPNKRFQRVGLAAMSLKPIETVQLTDVLFEFLRDKNPEFRWYARASLVKFTKFPESKKADLGKQLLEIVRNKEKNELSFEEFLLLAKFPSEETARFLTEQLMKEGKENRIRIFRYAAFRALKEMGESYYDEAVEYVNKHGSPEIKKGLLESENLWRTEKE
jgi:hypothetical protein